MLNKLLQYLRSSSDSNTCKYCSHSLDIHHIYEDDLIWCGWADCGCTNENMSTELVTTVSPTGIITVPAVVVKPPGEPVYPIVVEPTLSPRQHNVVSRYSKYSSNRGWPEEFCS